VIESFNELIAKDLYKGEATVKQTEVVDLILKKMGGEDIIKRDKIFKNHWLDIENLYRQSGWNVEYDKADWNVGG
jgi:hypothetical protein